MTIARDLKALVRQRMEKTGERYVAALRHVRRELHAPSSSKIAESTDGPAAIRAVPTWEPVVIRRFRMPEDAKAARPINDRAILPLARFVDITGICEFPEHHRVTCQLETDSGICDQEFGEGYVMRGNDGREVFVGGICAKRQFGDHVKFAREAARARNDVRVGDYVARLEDLLTDPRLDPRLQAVEARRHDLCKQVDTVRDCFTYSMIQRIQGLTKKMNGSISLEFERLEKREDRNKKIYTISKWLSSIVATVIAPKALTVTRFGRIASGLHKAHQTRKVAEASIAHSAKTLQTWCASLEGLGDCESALDEISKDLAAFTDAENLKGLVWLCDSLAERLATTRSILRVLGQRTVTDEMARAVFDRWEKEMLAAHGNRNYRVP